MIQNQTKPSATHKTMSSRLSLFILLVLTMTDFISPNAFGMTNDKVAIPDFAYPKTVAEYANKNYMTAITTGNSTLLLRSLIDYVTAEELITKDNTALCLDRLTEAEAKSGDPACRALIDLIRASVYYNYYQADRWTFNRRELPLSPLPENISEWSGQQLCDTIAGLLDEALSFEKQLKEAPVDHFKDIISADRLQKIYYPTLYDFVANKAIKLYNSLLSNNNDYAKASETLTDKLAAMHREGSAPFINYTLQKTEDNSYDSMMALYRKYDNTEYSGQILVKAGYGVETQSPHSRDFADTLKAFIDRYPRYWDINSLKNKLNRLMAENADISLARNVAPGNEFDITAKITNAPKATVKFYRLSGKEYESQVKRSMIAGLKPAAVFEVSCDSVPPFVAKRTIRAKLPTEGFYAVVLSTPSEPKGTSPYLDVVQCSSLFGLKIAQNNSHNIYLLSLDPVNGKPVSGASVDLKTSTWNHGKSTSEVRNLGKTDNRGLLSIGNGGNRSGRYIFKKGDRRFISSESSIYVNSEDENTDYNASGYTSLGIYRPGDKVDFVFVASYIRGKQQALLADAETKVELYDANYTLIDSIEGRTDAFGRVAGSMVIPKGLLTGNYTLELNVKDSKSEWTSAGSKNFMVSDYKMPKFRVEVTSVLRDYPAKGDVTLKGKALTYTDFPVADAKVSIGLSTCERFRWWFGNPERKISSCDTRTDAKGDFSVTFDSKTLKEANSGAFVANFDVTSAEGETQSCDKFFTQGKPYIINNDSEYTADLNKPVQFNLTVMDGEYQPVKGLEMTYTIKTDSAEPAFISKGRFTTSDTGVDLSKVPQGSYVIEFCTADTALAQPTQAQIMLYNPEEKNPASDAPLWADVTNVSIKQNKAEIIYSVGTDKAYIYCVTADSKGNFDVRGFESSKGYHTLEARHLDKQAETTYVTLITVQDFKTVSYSFSFENEDAKKKVNVAVESFHDRLLPGDSETWTFKTTDAYGNPIKSALMLDVYNLALDKILLHRFPKVSFAGIDVPAGINFRSLGGYTIWEQCSAGFKHLSTVGLDIPDFNDYGLRFGFGGMRRYKYQLRGAAVDNDAVIITGSMANADAGGNAKMKVEEEAVMEAPASAELLTEAVVTVVDSDNGGRPSTEEYRPAEMPLMLFRPMLTTDEQGCRTLTFTVPNANASWRMALVAFTESLQSAALQKDFITSKPLMVSANAPRFLRAGDNAKIIASVQNATDSLLSAVVTVEVFNPMTGKVTATYVHNVDIAAGDASEISTDVPADETMTAVGYRVKAASGRFTDGEQIALPVLPSVEPVVESTPFYLAPGQKEFELKLPKLPADADVNLQYCDNPRWMIVSALPGLLKDAASDANSAAAAIYSASVASGIIREMPQVAAALKEWSANPSDSMLVSMLEKNQELKTTLLNATPWVRDAADDTERMARLSLLFDRKETEANFNKSLEVLKKLHADSGGWLWFAQAREASLWTTLNVLGMMGDLKQLGYLPKSKDLDRMIVSSIKWADDQAVKEWKKYGHPENFDEYVACRDMFGDIPKSTQAENLTAAVVQYMVKNWRRYDLGEKPMVAMILFRHGYKELARNVLESMRQFSEYKPQRGMWFPSFDDSKPWWNMSKNIATALALDAFAEIEPERNDAERLAQWLVMQKEAQNWGTSVATTQVISALLNTSGMQLSTASESTLTLGNTVLEPQRIECLTGSFSMPLNSFSPSGKLLTVSRSGEASTQAFGSIVMRYKSDPKDVKASSCDAVAISKRLLKRVSTDSGYAWQDADGLRVGDRVKVLLTVTVNRDLEYVVINDNRAAALEPVDQLPGYLYSEGVGFYRENNNADTRFFISYMPKGTYQLAYELNVNNAGTFTSGLATLQSQYAPALTAHSAGTLYVIGE